MLEQDIVPGYCGIIVLYSVVCYWSKSCLGYGITHILLLLLIFPFIGGGEVPVGVEMHDIMMMMLLSENVNMFRVSL